MNKYSLLTATVLSALIPLGAMADSSTGVDVSITLAEEAWATTESHLEFGSILIQNSAIGKTITIDPLSGNIDASDGAKVVTAGNRGEICTTYYAGFKVEADAFELTMEGADTSMTFVPQLVDTINEEGNHCYYIGGTVEIPANAELGTYNGHMVVDIMYDDITSVDVDMASEMVQYSKDNILAQAAQSMLSQANQTPQGVLQLLQ